MPILLLVLVTASASPPAHAELETLVEQAVTASPSVDSLRHRERALRERAEVAGAWPDPLISIEYANAPVSSWALSDHPMSGIQLRVEQTLRPPGWSGARRDIHTHRADAGAHALAESKLRLAWAVREAWWMLAQTRWLRRLTEQHLTRTEELLAAVRFRYETGVVGQHAVLRLELLRDRLSDDLGDFDRQAVELEAALLQALAAPEPLSFSTPEAVQPLPPMPEADWAALAIAHRPRLAQLRSEQHAAEQTARVARLDALPDPKVWAGYRIRTVETELDDGTDFVSVGVAVPLPLGSGRQAAGEQAAALQDAQSVTSAYDAEILQITATARALRARWQRAWEKTQNYDQTLIPAAHATLETTQADFTVGRADFASLFDAEVALIDLERSRIVAAVDTHLQQAEAMALLGTVPHGGAP